MADYVLSVWRAGDEPATGAPIRLCRVGDDAVLAEHAEGFDTSDFLFRGAVVDPEDSLTAAGLMDEQCKAAVGDELWARLTPGAIGAAIRPLIGSQRIYLDFRSDGLSRYPWELLRCANQYIFTAGNTRWSLGRPEPTDHFSAGTPPPADHPLRVLVVIGNRPDDQNIRAAEELMIIEREAHRRNAEVLLTALHYPGAAAIESTLKDFRPHVFHFIGHGRGLAGDPPQIFVYSATTKTVDPWSAERIRTVFAQAPPRVVVLNACQTAHAPTEASSLVQAFIDAGCLATVTMMGEIQGAASEAFSQRFYQEIFSGAPVDTATTRARLSVGSTAVGPVPGSVLQVRSNWALPRVTVRGDANTAVTMPYALQPAATQWLIPDFVTRWAERWQAWTAMDGSHKGENGTEARLAVLWGGKEAGKRELLNTLAEARARAGDAVIYVDLFGDRTGRWPDVLERIADAAAKAGFDATALRATARSGGPSAAVIAAFRAELERARRFEGDAGPVLIVLDGLSDWTADEVNQTVLPELCRPFLRAAAGSRLRLMISLEEPVSPDLWGSRPERWQPIEVGAFDVEEWTRAVTHFRDYWFPRVPAAKQAAFSAVADAMANYPMAQSLSFLRIAAGGQS